MNEGLICLIFLLPSGWPKLQACLQQFVPSVASYILGDFWFCAW